MNWNAHAQRTPSDQIVKHFWRQMLPAILLAACAASVLASPTTVTLRPVADAELQQAQPDANFGASPTMVSGKLGPIAGGVLRRAVLRFDLSGRIPAGSIISAVSLQVRVVRIPAGPVNSNFDLRRILQPWAEPDVTWNSRLPAAPWQVPGVTGAADALGTASSSVFVSGLGSYTFPSTPALVADVQAWVNDAGTNSGWLLISENESSFKTARHFATREDAINAPVLTVVYTLSPPAIVNQPLDQTADEGGAATFSVVASGIPPLSYQWQFEGNDITDATNSVLTLSNVQTNQAGAYTVLVGNANGVTTSRAALLTVVPASELRPHVTINSPQTGDKFPEHSDVTVTATATTSNATISSVEFFTNGMSAAVFTNSSISFVLSNLAAGAYDLKATVTDSAGRSNDSAAVSFRVQAPPRFSFTSPVDGARLQISNAVAVTAKFLPPTLEGEVARVDFFENGLPVGAATAPPFSVNWLPITLGNRTLGALAVDDLGQTGTNLVRVFVYQPENTPPKVAITNAPPNFSRRSDPLIPLVGTASDDVSVLRVEVQVNDGPWQPATGTTVWRNQATLVAGPNAVRVRAVDQALNFSQPVTRFYTFVVTNSLTVSVEPPGSGSVTPDLTRKPLEIGAIYRVNAKPAPGRIFAGWDGAASQGAVLNFVMQSNLTLTAQFVTNPFTARAGNYAGLVWDTNSLSPESSGLLGLSLTKSGAFSGTLNLAGSRRPFRGQFDPRSGLAQTAISRAGLSPVSLILQLDLANRTDLITGFGTDGASTNPVLAQRNIFNARSNPAPQAGRTNFFLLSDQDPRGPVASALALVSRSGVVAFRGGLLGGRPIQFTTSLGSDGNAPFYVAPGVDEVFIGQLMFGTNSLNGVGGSVFWVRSSTNTSVIELRPVTGGF